MKEFNASALVARLSSKPVPAHVFYEYCIYRSTGDIQYRYIPVPTYPAFRKKVRNCCAISFSDLNFNPSSRVSDRRESAENSF